MQNEGEQGEMARRRRPAQGQRPRRGINENYARELLELHTLGVEGGYTQKDVQEVARAFTGWTILDPRGAMGSGRGGTFVFNPRMHDDGEKVVLGQKIPAGGGAEDGRRVLDILVRHPSTAKFISTKLARRFVSDNPSPATVERAAAAFSRSGGDIKETLRALFTSGEFNSAAARRAKIKTPFELAVSAVRVLGAETDARPAFQQWLARMGEPLYLYQAPTGYPDTAEDWVNAGALLERLNFSVALASNRIPGTRANLKLFEADTKAAILDKTIAVVLAGDISPNTRAMLVKQIEQPLPEVKSPDEVEDAPEMPQQGRGMRRQARLLAPSGNAEVFKIVSLVLGTPEFQRQ